VRRPAYLDEPTVGRRLVIFGAYGIVSGGTALTLGAAAGALVTGSDHRAAWTIVLPVMAMVAVLAAGFGGALVIRVEHLLDLRRRDR
jgi:hypothetical protein